jgi:sec-independent protein translocase protein TatA
MGLDNPIHIAFLLILLLLVFGAKRLPEMGRSLGEGMRGFKDSLSGEHAHSAPAVGLQPAQAIVPQPPTIVSQPPTIVPQSTQVAGVEPAQTATAQPVDPGQ